MPAVPHPSAKIDTFQTFAESVSWQYLLDLKLGPCERPTMTYLILVPVLLQRTHKIDHDER